MKYRFNGPSLNAIRSNVTKAPMLNALVENTGLIEMNSEEMAPLFLNEVCNIINELPSPKHSAYSKAVCSDMIKTIDPAISLTPTNKIFMPNIIKPHVIVANMYEKKKSPVILDLINYGDAHLTQYDAVALKTLKAASKISKTACDQFGIMTNAYIVFPAVTNHMINRLLTLM